MLNLSYLPSPLTLLFAFFIWTAITGSHPILWSQWEVGTFSLHPPAFLFNEIKKGLHCTNSSRLDFDTVDSVLVITVIIISLIEDILCARHYYKYFQWFIQLCKSLCTYYRKLSFRKIKFLINSKIWVSMSLPCLSSYTLCWPATMLFLWFACSFFDSSRTKQTTTQWPCLLWPWLYPQCLD